MLQLYLCPHGPILLLPDSAKKRRIKKPAPSSKADPGKWKASWHFDESHKDFISPRTANFLLEPLTWELTQFQHPGPVLGHTALHKTQCVWSLKWETEVTLDRRLNLEIKPRVSNMGDAIRVISRQDYGEEQAHRGKISITRSYFTSQRAQGLSLTGLSSERVKEQTPCTKPEFQWHKAFPSCQKNPALNPSCSDSLVHDYRNSESGTFQLPSAL